MRIVDIIDKKRQGKELDESELIKMLNAPSYQLSAFLMSIMFQGMSKRETVLLTNIMKESGDTYTWGEVLGILLDKHSTGGVGDKITLLVIPMVATLGGKIIKMSGRALGYTGGTIDKLESIKGFNVELSRKKIIEQLNKINCALVSQSNNLTPLDKTLYALRDITATVESIPLIASSIMSKKLAMGADKIVLDIKVGKGALIKNLNDAKQLASLMVDIGSANNKETVAVITKMDSPLGYNIGNALEVREVIEFLSPNGRKAHELYEISMALAGEMLILSGIAYDKNSAKSMLDEVLSNGDALKKFNELISYQGGDLATLPTAKNVIPVIAKEKGFIQEIDAEIIGRASMKLGAGRLNLENSIDYSAGIVLEKKAGDEVEKGDTLAFLHTNSDYSESMELVYRAYTFSQKPIALESYIIEIIN